ncbi:helix-turn-helix domain-containing protein [Glycomyces buryatensis]|uniref:Helix-turn-helix domain-containing protein n=1 Tax=Glycomyces buryatensis TaxID=2570927 RepID=A0A4S8PVV5_9ACTN|nr:helix-turn-helix transcriptional regulator [Glycomyces buryatensis]THV33952.1 helix-turn-helix domain-containing protein [Glycomyces buryatensis]
MSKRNAPPAGGSAGGPTALRMIMGGYLRRLREGANVTREEAAFEIRASASKISRMELGRVSFKPRDIKDLLVMYGVGDDAEIERLLVLVVEANEPGWWHRYGEALPDWFSAYLDLEGAASVIRSYDVQFIPGLLQTRDYARSVFMIGFGTITLQEIDDRVKVRSDRKKILTREKNPATLWTVIDEAALHRPIGGREVMRAQLEALIEACEMRNVLIQIIPFSTGRHSGAGGAFTWLRFNDSELNDVVYLEHLTSGLYLDREDEVDTYKAAMEHLCVQALQPNETPDFIRKILVDHYSQ